MGIVIFFVFAILGYTSSQITYAVSYQYETESCVEPPVFSTAIKTSDQLLGTCQQSYWTGVYSYLRCEQNNEMVNMTGCEQNNEMVNMTGCDENCNGCNETIVLSTCINGNSVFM